MLQTALIEDHRALGARLVDFAGWEMPVQYAGIIEESKAVRHSAGIFDVSHMGRVWMRGDRVFDFLQNLTTNDLGKLQDLHAQYSLMCTPEGGVVDDIIVYRITTNEYMVVWNSSNRDKDLRWVSEHAEGFGGVSFDDQTMATGMIAVQGPAAVEITDRLAGGGLADADRFSVSKCRIAGVEAMACRTGYTGEDGFELIMPAVGASAVWSAILREGAVACGLGARDVLRVEAGLPLYGHELSDRINPIEAGLGWVVSKTKSFIGSEPLQQVRSVGPSRKLVGIAMDSKIPPREGYPVFVGDERVGEISSGVYSPALEKGIGFAFVSSDRAQTGQPASVEIRGRRQSAHIASKRFLKDRA